MHIKSIIIDGFKSYAQRTEINGFDPLFNAITGLNGSGKSNILDSICFLLGISNLTQVRAANLQDLVYKSGQAGVTKATVSITFDNANKKQSPLGYEQYNEITVTRQVVIGGRNKYLINGCNANNTRVQDLFRSVQLNVNNPHFLIMQGRITKVLNMKPPEILAMIEEAAGTRMYESKKQSAQKTIEKKDAKLKEIDTILDEEITPTLAKLKEERSSYLEYQKIMRELEHLTKLHVAYQFVCAEELHLKSAEELSNIQENIKALQEKIIEMEEKVQEIDELIAKLEKKKDEESGSVLEDLEGNLKEIQKQEAKMTSNVDHKKENLKAEQKKEKNLIKSFEEDKATLKNKEKELNKLNTSFNKLQETGQKDLEGLEAAKKHFQAVSTGLSSNVDGEDATLADQIMAAKNEISTAETETKQAEMKLKHADSEIKKKQSELKKTEQEYKKDQSLYETVGKNVKKLEVEISKLGYEDGKEEQLLSKKKILKQEVSQLQEKVDALEAKFPQLQFEYKDPEKNFDRQKVRGLIAKLIKVKDINAATGLEVTAGGKLYNVVVDNEVTGKKLLQKGELKRRLTIIPLNKIIGRTLPNDVVKRAEHLVGKQNAYPALSLIGYDNDLQAAMEYVFGNTFICSNMDTAKMVCFDERIKKRSVTLAGESFDPRGTLSGGARSQNVSILTKLQEMAEVIQILNEKSQQLAHIEKELVDLTSVAEKFRLLKQQYDLKFHEAELLKTRLQQGFHNQQLEEISHFQKTVDQQKEVLAKAKEVKKKSEAKVKDLEAKIKNAKAVREQELKTAEEEIKKTKKQAENSSKLMKEKEQEVEAIRLETEELKQAIAGYEQQIAAVIEAIKNCEEQVVKLNDAASEIKDQVKQAQAELNKQKDLLKARCKEIQDKHNEKNKILKDNSASQLKIKQLEHDISKHNKESKEASKKVEYLLSKYDWISEDKKYFGQANTAYDFQANDPKEAGNRLQKLQETKEKLGKTVNMRAMNMLGKAEEQYNDLIKKKRIVVNDKAKIAAVIAELDEKKNQALKKAWEQVNKDFGSIFSTLLPGTKAKLVPPEGQNVLDGLEVKVAFGSVWKESLSELSGGQRSLVALSLILSLLLFKPAPIYILDEVDAALDLSHTQNIGQMLRTHFRHSQFIVVSLKDGMFNNANVLYKTKFVDGVSTVTRYVQNQSTPKSAQNSAKINHRTKEIEKISKKARIEESPLTTVAE